MLIKEKQLDSYFSGEMTETEKDLFLREMNADGELKKKFIRIQNAKGALRACIALQTNFRPPDLLPVNQ